MLRNFLKHTMHQKFNNVYKTKSITTTVDFGKAATEYGKHRHGLPLRFFQELKQHGIGIPRQRILDIGTGTGDTARQLAKMGSIVIGIDPSENMLQQAKAIDERSQVQVTYQVGVAENIKQPTNHFDVVSVAQAYHWLNPHKALPEILRVMKRDGGQFAMLTNDWKSKVGAAWMSESLIREYNPNWIELDFYQQPYADLLSYKLTDIREISFMYKEEYTQVDWVGRTCTSYGIGPCLSASEVQQFKKELASKLHEKFSNSNLTIWHHCHAFIARPPVEQADDKIKCIAMPIVKP